MNIYQNCYNLINEYLYGSSIVAGSWEELTAVLLATIGTVFLFSIPFIIVYKTICLIIGGK